MSERLCTCEKCLGWRRTAIAHWSKAKTENPGAVVFIQPRGSTAAYAIVEDARLINSLCGHMIRQDTFGCIDVFVCDLEGVGKVLRRNGHKTVMVREVYWGDLHAA